MKWKEARIQTFKADKPIYLLIVMSFLFLLGSAATKAELWEQAALSTTFIAFGSELNCYYYSFLMATAILHYKNERVGLYLLILTALTQFIAWAPFKGVMPCAFDEQFTWMSLSTLIVFFIIAWESASLRLSCKHGFRTQDSG